MYQTTVPKRMYRLKRMSILVCLFTTAITSTSYAAVNTDQSSLQSTVDNAIKPLIQKYTIPGMAIGITIDGKNYFYNYGVASKKTKQAVTNTTNFEIGSLSKTLTVTLATYAQINGQLSLSDSVSKYLPYLRGSSFDNISLINLGTHTPGNFPLQIPDNVKNYDQLMTYYKDWKPEYAAGMYRNYSNPGIGLLGIVTAKSINMPFEDAMEKVLFPKLGMKHTYINVPANQMKNYAQGYNKKDEPVRVSPDVLASEAYGVKTNTADLMRFIDANMNLIKLDNKVGDKLGHQLDAKLQRAISDTHTGYFTVGEITQDLIWEQYPSTAQLLQLLAGNSDVMAFQSNAVTKLSPPLPPQENVWLNKTGGTGGFGSYALFNPAKKMGIVILANKNYPNAERVTAAYQILTQLEERSSKK